MDAHMPDIDIDLPQEEPVLGVDLSRHYVDVRRLVHRQLGKKIDLAGLDREDVISETCRRILRANIGTSPYDPRKAKLSTYIMMQAISALRNLLKPHKRMTAHETVGYLTSDGKEVDAALAEDLEADTFDIQEGASTLGKTPAERKALMMLARGWDDAAVKRWTGVDPWQLRRRLELEHGIGAPDMGLEGLFEF